MIMLVHHLFRCDCLFSYVLLISLSFLCVRVSQGVEYWGRVFNIFYADKKLHFFIALYVCGVCVCVYVSATLFRWREWILIHLTKN